MKIVKSCVKVLIFRTDVGGNNRYSLCVFRETFIEVTSLSNLAQYPAIKRVQSFDKSSEPMMIPNAYSTSRKGKRLYTVH